MIHKLCTNNDGAIAPVSTVRKREFKGIRATWTHWKTGTKWLKWLYGPDCSCRVIEQRAYL